MAKKFPIFTLRQEPSEMNVVYEVSEGLRVLKTMVYISDNKIFMTLEINPSFTFGRIKKYIAEELNLKPASLAIFGLFKVSPHLHHLLLELCNDDERIPASVDHVTFRRLCFDREKEMSIIRTDIYALNLIFWEGKYLLQNGSYPGDYEEISKLYEKVDRFSKQKAVSRKAKCVAQLRQRRINLVPICEQATVRKLRNLYDKLQSTSSNFMYQKKKGNYTDAVLNLPLSKIREYVDLMHTLEHYYWAYYYRILDCVLCGRNASLLACYLNLNTDFVFDVVLNRTCLSFIGKTDSDVAIQLVDFPWLTIQWISKNPCNHTISFEVPVKNPDGRTKDMVITFRTNEYELLYSIAKHIMDIHVKVKAEAMTCNFIPVQEKVELALSLAPEGNNELKLSILKAFLTPKREHPPYSTEYSNRYIIAPDCIHPNIISFRASTDLWHVLLRNSQPIMTGSKNTCAGLPRMVCRYSVNESKKQINSWPETNPISRDLFRKVTVHTFREGPYHIHLFPRHETIKEFKEYLITFLGITHVSLSIFGLFECPPQCKSPLDNTGRLYLDSESMPEGSDYAFRRLSFNEKMERQICISDLQAFRLIIAEADYMVEHCTVLPVLPTVVHQKVLGILKCQAFYADLSLFIPTYWWMYYYRADNVAEPPMPNSLYAHFSVNGQSFFFIDHLGQGHIEVPLTSLRCVATEKQIDHHRPGLLVCEMAYPRTKERTLNSMAMRTTNQQFFYSIIKYLFSIQPKHGNPDKFVNSTFKGPTCSMISEKRALVTVNNMFLC